MTAKKQSIIKEPNIFENYSHPGMETYNIFSEAREAILKRQKRRWKTHQLRKANTEIQKIRRNLDLIHEFSQGLNLNFFSSELSYGILLIDGTFTPKKKGDKSIDSTLGIDLGVRPNDMYNYGQSSWTIDESIVYDKAGEWINKNILDLQEAGFNSFKTKKSRFFFFDKSDIEKFIEKKKLNLEKLIPIIHPTDHIGLKESIKPEKFEDYVPLAPKDYTTYRIKTTIDDKLLDYLCLPKGAIKKLSYKPEPKNIHFPTSDFAGLRIYTNSEQHVYSLFETFKKFKKPQRIGNFDVKYLGIKRDFYEHPEEHTYPAIHIIVEVAGRGYENIKMEIQIIDTQEKYFHIKEILGKEVHKRGSKKTMQISKDMKPCAEHYKQILENIFATKKIEIPF